MNDLTVLIDAWRWGQGPTAALGAPCAAIRVHWQADAAALTPAASAHIEQRWAAYVAEAKISGKSLFNGPVSRLLGATRQGNEIELSLAPTDYKTFLVTCLRDRPWFDAHAPEAITPGLGSSVLLTQGNRALLGIRSSLVSAYAGRAHLLGGVLEHLGTAQFPADTPGLLAHLRLELLEEAAITSDDLLPEPGFPRFLGLVRDEHWGQPEAIWHWETHTPLHVIGERINAKEHSGWLELSRDPPDPATWRQMTPVARHAWRIWSER